MQKSPERVLLETVNEAIAQVDSALKRKKLEEALRKVIDNIVAIAIKLKIKVSNGFLKILRETDDRGRHLHSFDEKLARSALDVLCRIKTAFAKVIHQKPIPRNRHDVLHQAYSTH